MLYSLTWLPSVLHKAGLEVVEEPDWQSRGHGDMQKILGVLCHHTAEPKSDRTEPALDVLTHGRPGLSGPLCHLALGQTGKYYMIAAGKAYHAGAGNWKGVTRGNSNLIGIEAKNDGVGEPWPEIQMSAYARGCAAIAVHCGFKDIMVAGHKEYAIPRGRKIDPSFDMAQFRQRVSGYMGAMV